MPRVPLDALLRRVSLMAEQMFDKQGDVDPIWLVESASGEQQIIVSPITAPSPLAAADRKDQVAARMREHFAENDIVRYASAMEAWTLHEPERRKITALEYAAMGYTLANHPDGREISLGPMAKFTAEQRARRSIARAATRAARPP